MLEYCFISEQGEGKSCQEKQKRGVGVGERWGLKGRSVDKVLGCH